MPCTDCGAIDHPAPCPERPGEDWSGAVPERSFDYRAGYEAGIRKAQELAKLHAHYRDCEGDEALCKTCDGSGVEPWKSHCIEWDSFDQAIEREIER